MADELASRQSEATGGKPVKCMADWNSSQATPLFIPSFPIAWTFQTVGDEASSCNFFQSSWCVTQITFFYFVIFQKAKKTLFMCPHIKKKIFQVWKFLDQILFLRLFQTP